MDQYNIANFTNAPSRAAVAYGAPHKLGNAYRVNQDIDEVHTVIGVNGLPIVFGFTVYESFESDAVASTGMVPMPGPNEQVVGGHAVVAVGYNDSKKLVTVRNSWGSSWGVNGYCYFPYEYFLSTSLVSDLWTATSVS
jgi:C1A family cysteine protease